MEEPKFILLYHAIDLIAGIIDKPSPFYDHERLYFAKISEIPSSKLRRLRSQAIAKLNSKILADELKLYLKPFEALFYQVSDRFPNNPETSFDYPSFAVDREFNEITQLPECVQNYLFEDEFLISRIFSPQSHELLVLSREAHDHLKSFGFSFDYLEEDQRNFYSLSKFGISAIDSFSDWEDGDTSAIVYLKMTDLSKLFLSNVGEEKQRNSGRPKKHHVEISLLKFLINSNDRLDIAGKNYLDQYLEKIGFSDAWEEYKQAGPAIRKQIVDDLHKDQNTLVALIADLKNLGIDLESLLEVQSKHFVNTLNEEEALPRDRMLQEHFNLIRSKV